MLSYNMLISTLIFFYQRRRTAVDELNMRSIFEENDVICVSSSHLWRLHWLCLAMQPKLPAPKKQHKNG